MDAEISAVMSTAGGDPKWSLPTALTLSVSLPDA